MLYRITGDVKYQDWGWNIFNNIVKHCKTEVGFSGIKDVGSVGTAKDDAMQSFFLSETLKYLYLLFSPKDFVPLDKYVSVSSPFICLTVFRYLLLKGIHSLYGLGSEV